MRRPLEELPPRLRHPARHLPTPTGGDVAVSDSALGEAAAHARRAGLLAGAVVAVESAGSHGPVDARYEPAELVVRAGGVARADSGLEAPEPGLHLGSAAPVLEALALRPMNPLFL